MEIMSGRIEINLLDGIPETPLLSPLLRLQLEEVLRKGRSRIIVCKVLLSTCLLCYMLLCSVYIVVVLMVDLGLSLEIFRRYHGMLLVLFLVALFLLGQGLRVPICLYRKAWDRVAREMERACQIEPHVSIERTRLDTTYPLGRRSGIFLVVHCDLEATSGNEQVS